MHGFVDKLGKIGMLDELGKIGMLDEVRIRRFVDKH